MSITLVPNPPDQEPLLRLSKDLRKGAALLSNREARYLVDLYYQVQDYRKSSNNQIRSMSADNEPISLFDWIAANLEMLESDIRRALNVYANGHEPSLWALSIHGIGPIIAAGLLAHIDITRAPTAGHIWRFAGLDPTVKWEKKTKRPWNAALKTLCWKIGESFVKVSNNEKDFYGHVWAERKAIEWERNKFGAFALQCDASLAKLRPGGDQEARYWYSGCLTPKALEEFEATPSEKRQGLVKKLASAAGSGVKMLPPAHIHARAKRYAVKLFLSHYQAVAYECQYGTPPPKPYILSQGNHAHYLAPPNWPMA